MKKQQKDITGNDLFSNLGKYHSIDVVGDWGLVRDRIGFSKSRKVSILWRAAAIAILVLGIGFTVQHYVIVSPDKIIASTAENQKEIVLPDGTLVFLNKNTSLTYPKIFNRQTRHVSLSGEGFFEVTRDVERPFLISAADLANVEVLGTSFNIKAPPDMGSVSVQVVEGSVAFSQKESNNTREILKKGDQAELQNGVITMSTDLDKNFLSWKTGVIYFEQEEIGSVIDVLSNHYNRVIILESSVDTTLRFTSTINNQELDSVLDELKQILGLSYSMVDGKILITNTD